MDLHPKKPNKIRDIVRLQQILKKWRKLANSNSNSSSSSSKPSSSSSSKNTSTSINQFLKRTLSLNDRSHTHTTSTHDHCSNDNASSASVPKGYLAVSVGEEQKRFVIPTEYLGRHVFHVLLREAEEEFGFEQTGVLRIPCPVSVFENVLKMVAYQPHNKRSEHQYCEYDYFFNHRSDDAFGFGCCSSGSHLDLGFSHDSPMCR
ncbi:Small auxin-up RNA [Trema orientale]|uniref:Small auxin-up RNA n=1 Tax=Trema orientale TaxID=63057 RepID=A0A2P5G1H7_TREOI|nr:Small auxin-up RNA [Trema orientale]